MSEKSEREGHRARLRERFLAGEAGSRSDEALLELLLTYAIPQRDVQPLAKTLIGRFGSLENVLAAPPAELCQTDGLKQTSIVLLKAAHEFLLRGVRAKTALKNPPPVQDKSRSTAVAQQELMPQVLDVTETKPNKPRGAAFRAPVARKGTELFGKAVLKEAIEMLPRLPDSENPDDAREFLRKSLHFSAEETRKRYAAYITRRMFREGRADGALRHFAKAFPKTTELRDVCFYRFCKGEPLMLKIAQDLLIPLGSHEISRWYLKESEVGGEEAEQATTNAAGAKLHEFLAKVTAEKLKQSEPTLHELESELARKRKALQAVDQGKSDDSRPRLVREIRELTEKLDKLNAERAEWQQEALHYSDIMEFYLYVQPKPRCTLEELLEDYCYQTDEGNWRPPLTEDEKKEKSGERQRAVRRQIQRLFKLLESGETIPAEVRPDDLTLAEWIRHCKRTGLYAQGKLLFERGGLNLDKLSEEEQVNVEEDYQVCVRGLSQSKPSAQASRQQKMNF